MTNTTKKAANYSDTDISMMKSAYAGAYSEGESVSAESNKNICRTIATELKRSIPQIRSKLASLGVYKKADAVVKEAKSGGKKNDIVSAITNAGVDLTKQEAEGLSKATAYPLQAILAQLTNQAARIIELESGGG